MLNYKCKSHRGRSAENKSEDLTIVEVVQGKITRVYARVIINKSISSIIPVVVERVVAGSLICTGEHKTYTALHGLDLNTKQCVIKEICKS
jgi:hypothetical protein